MRQVSELDPITVFGKPPPRADLARGRRVATASAFSARSNLSTSWWRVLLAVLVTAVWIAAAVSATGATFSTAPGTDASYQALLKTTGSSGKSRLPAPQRLGHAG